MGWVQIFAKAPAGNGYGNSQAAKRIDEHVQMFGAVFFAPDGMPIKNENGEYEIRCYNPATSEIIKALLTGHYGLEIVRTVTNS